MISVAMAFIVSLSAGAADLPSRLEKTLKASSVPRASLGLAVYDLGHLPSAPIFAVNETADMTPASVTKILTAAAVLNRLGPSAKFQTALWSAGTVADGQLTGDLVLKGGGDPGFISESMWYLVNEFVRTGIKKINGDIIVDDTDFDFIRTDVSRDPERVDRAYDAPVGAMSFNWNSINIFVRPSRPGVPPTIFLDPIDNGYKIENKARTAGKTGSRLEVSRLGNRILVRGTIGSDQPEAVVYKNVDDPAEWSGRNLAAFLAQRGIQVKGAVKSGKLPARAVQLAKADSRPVAQHVADMMKFSNNYVAEMLTKTLALQSGIRPGTLDGGMKVIRSEMESLAGLESNRMVIVNPSGLSRRNRIKSADLAMVLVQAQKNFPWFAEFLSAFPLAGQDGTLKRRMKDAEGWVRAKTGNLSGVVALAGYAGHKDGSSRAFVFIYNGKAELADTVRHLFDDMAAELVQ